MKFFNSKVSPRRAQKLQEISFRGFGGGWNAVDDDVDMSMKYMPSLVNFHRTPGGAQEVRFGTKRFADVSGVVTGTPIDGEYFNTRLIVVTSTGQIASISDAGVATAIWNSTIAAALVGSPAGWANGVTQVNFVPFRNTMIVHNGRDKPVSISDTYVATYLQDLGTGSNVNVPIGKYGCAVENYHVVAGIPSAKTTIYVSSKGTAGTFPGDPAPNDSISIDVGSYAPERATEIIGVAGFRSNLLVFFPAATLVVALGTYDADEVHQPEVPDTLPHFGLLSHRSIVATETDLIFADTDGINSARRNLFSGLVDSSELSAIIAPAYQGAMGSLTQAQMSVGCFAVRDTLRSEIFVFPPVGAGRRIFVYSVNQRLKYQSWSEFAGWDFTWGASSSRGRVFFGKGTRIYQLGNDAFDERYYADEMADLDKTWAVSTAMGVGQIVYDAVGGLYYQVLVSHTSGGGTFEEDRDSFGNYWTEYDGIPIEFQMELPWLDGKEPMSLKHMRYLAVMTKGTAHFTVELYVDNRYKDVDGTIIHNPITTLEMVGNDYRGAGDDTEWGGARRSNDPRLYGFQAKFKTGKFKFTGSSTEPLMIIGFSFLFARGKWHR